MLSKHLISQNSRYKRARSVKKATHFLSSQRLHSQNTKKVDKTKKKMFNFNNCCHLKDIVNEN